MNRSGKWLKWAIRGSRAAAAILFVAGISAWVHHAFAEEDSSDFRPYALQHARASDIEASLNSVLPARSEVLCDNQANRILVRGSPLAHQIAEKVLRSLDRAPAQQSAPDPLADSRPVLRVYPSGAGQAKTVAAQLQQDFGATPGVRVVCDERTAQLLVVAPPEVQARIAERLGGRQTAPVPAAVAPVDPRPPLASAARPPAVQPDSPREVQLNRMTGQQMEAALAAAFGDRLVPAAATRADEGVYQVAWTEGRPAEVSVDRRSNRVTIRGNGPAGDSFVQLVRALDAPQSPQQTTQLVALRSTRQDDIQRTVEAIRASNAAREGGRRGVPGAGQEPLAARLFQPRARNEGEMVAAQAQPPLPNPAAAAPVPPPAAPPPAKPAVPGEDAGGGMIGPVRVEQLPGDVVIVSGHPRDVQRVIELIQQIEKLSQVTAPEIRVYQLAHVDSVALATLLNQLYGEVFAARQGTVSITALVKPNALLLIGRKESVERVVELVQRLDVPVAPESQFQVFRLKHAAASTVQTTIQGFYPDRGGLSPIVRATADVRSNSVIVQASPRDMAEVAAMIARLDVATSEAVNELRIFRLNNAVAETLLPVLQDAIQAQVTAARAGAVPGAAPAPAAPGAAATPGARSSMLQFLTVDVQGQRRLDSGILSDVRVTADARANALVVSAPAESMPLIEALIKQLDQPPAVRAEIKVFTIVNGDAAALLAMLQDLFAQTVVPGQTAVATAAGQGETSLVPLRFSFDARTNSIIAAGSRGDLLVVEAILMRLDETEVRNRKSIVYRLKNAPAVDVSNAVNLFLRSERELQMIAPGLVSPFEQIEREVVVVPEPVSNALIVSATPRFFDEIMRLVEQIDQRPPMVMIQVMIAEVTLNNTDEFGVELGLQDTILFQRSGVFNFNNTPLGENNVFPQAVGTQGLSNLSVGRTNPALGFGGLVLSASSENVNLLLRALQERRRVEVLSRPQIMTLDNQPAYIQVGQRVPQIMGVSLTQFGQTNNINYEDVGLILMVTPRISPDGLVVMEIDANRSSVGPESEGIPVSVSATGQVIRAPRINRTLAQTTVSALSGQTVILGGLISREKTDIRRQVPLLGDIPVLGNLFRYDSKLNSRTELLVIMTPQIVRNEEDAERLKKVEAARMHWCLADVIDLHGEGGLRGRADEWTDAETPVVYPDQPAGGPQGPTLAPPAGPEMIPTPMPESGDGRPAVQPNPVAPRVQPIVPPSDGIGPNSQPRPPSKKVEQTAWQAEGTAHTEVSYGPPPSRMPALPSGAARNPLRGNE